MAFSIWDLGTYAVALVVVALISAFGAVVLLGVNSSSTNPAAWTIISNGLTGITNLAAQLGNVGLIVGGVAIIAILLAAFGGLMGGGRGAGE